LSCIWKDRAVAALLGGCAIQDVGWPRIPRNLTVDTTILGGSFYSFSRESNNEIPGVLYTELNQHDLFESLLSPYAQYDALAIMLGIKNESKLFTILNSFTNEADCKDQLVRNVDRLVLTQGDAQFLRVYSLLPHAEAEIQRCCDAADRAVRGVPWFQQTMPKLRWLEDELCYGLP
jgi:hypothetical protein